jgi:hypothetical protein
MGIMDEVVEVCVFCVNGDQFDPRDSAKLA